MGLESEVGIANDALLRLGQQQVTALTDDSRDGRLVNHFYSVSRDAVLASHPWNEAVKRATLALLAETPAWGFSRFYQLPGDFMRLIGLNDSTIRFRIEQDRIATDADAMSIKYIFQLTDPSKFSQTLAKAISARISAEISDHVTGSDSTSERMWNIYTQMMKEAQFQDSQQGPVDKYRGSAWLMARKSSGGVFRHIQDPS